MEQTFTKEIDQAIIQQIEDRIHYSLPDQITLYGFESGLMYKVVIVPEENYMGCVAFRNRKACNDLADGDCSLATWEQIKASIQDYESKTLAGLLK